MSWPVRALIGPSIWALAFAVIYASHGYGCARGWPSVAAPVGDLHSFVLLSLWFMALLALIGLNQREIHDDPTVRKIIRTADRTGLAATALTLFPVIGVSTCN